jgi:cytochrome P450
MGFETTGCPVNGKINLSESTLLDPAILAHPTDFYAAMRKDDPVHYDPKLDMYLVSRYDDLQAVLRDPITFSVQKGFAEQYAKGFQQEYFEILQREGGGIFGRAIMSDPPEHTRVRRLLDGAFTAHRVKTLEPRIIELTVGLIERLLDKGQVEIFSDFSMPLVSSLICEQLGVKLPSATIQRWTTALTLQISRMQTREQMLEAAKEMCEMQLFIIDQVNARKQHRTEDMISDLIYARLEGEDPPCLTFDETVSLVVALLVAGNETTATALTNLFFILATRPDIAQKLSDSVDDDRLLTRFIEELLRWEAPVRGITRMTTREVEVGGIKLPKGAHLLLLYASANDDESVFACPRQFDMERPNLGRHASFGGGVHRCAGAALARMELKVAAREIIRRMDHIELAVPPEEITYVPTVATHTIANLPMTFARRK